MGFFKAYDMRGTYGVDFDLAMVREVGKALVEVVGGKRWLVGRDCRVTSQDVHDALVEGLRLGGVSVTDIGLSTTPMVYYFTAADNFDGSVMVTASHNPPSDNGLKVSMRTALPVGYANGLDKVEAIVSERLRLVDRTSYRPIATEQIDNAPYVARYVEWMRKQITLPNNTIKYAVDCSNGMASLLAEQLFPGALIINNKLDGTFPNHSPNPLNPEARNQLAAIVREHSLDLGIIFDGDADRAMFIDECGNFIQPDYLTPFVAQSTLARFNKNMANGEKPKVLYDVRTSRGTIEQLDKMGCQGIMVPVGHAFAKPIMRREGAACGGELAGHYYFGDFFGCDSGVLAALCVLQCVAKARAKSQSVSTMVSEVASRYANSGELNFKVDDKDAAIARVLAAAARELPPQLGISQIDGTRLEYAEGWINIRKSNTEPYLRLIVECDTRERLESWVAIFSREIL